jgi:hypothetical protein
VRFENNSFVESINQKSFVVNLQGINSELKIRTENLNATIKIFDPVSGNLISQSTGNEISIKNSLNKIRIEIEKLPVDYVLYQNYPNPFNPTTSIIYQLKDEGFVLLKVFNSLGQEIATLVNEKQNAGKYEVKFDASSLPSGIYFYSIRVNDFVQTKKMTLLK